MTGRASCLNFFVWWKERLPDNSMDFTINFRFLFINRSITINRRWLQIAVVVAVLLASTVISFWGSRWIYLFLLAMLAGVAALLALLRQPNLGFIFVLIGGMFIPFTGPSGLNVAMVMIALMLGLWILDMFIVQRNIQFIHSYSFLPVIVFLTISTIAFIVGQIPWFIFARQAPISAQVGGYGIFLFSMAGMVLAAHLIKDIRWLKIIVFSFLALSSVYMVGRTIHLDPISKLYSVSFIAQSMFWTWLVALAAGQIIFNRDLTWRSRGMLIALVILTFYIGIVEGYDWKSGWVPPAVAVAILVGLRYRKLIILAIPVIIIVGLYLASDLIGTEGYSWGTRVDAWRIVLAISHISPLIGMGFANYYWYTPLFPIRGWSVSFNSHSQYVDLIAETGSIGLLVFFWVLFELGRLSWKLSHKLTDGFALGYVYGVLAGIGASIVAAFLGDWMLPFVYNVGLAGFRASILPWIFMGGVISLEHMLLQSSQKQRD
jgi:hypothetical protein